MGGDCNFLHQPLLLIKFILLVATLEIKFKIIFRIAMEEF